MSKKERDILRAAAEMLRSVPPETFGIGGQGVTHWYPRDELLRRIDEVLGEE